MENVFPLKRTILFHVHRVFQQTKSEGSRLQISD